MDKASYYESVGFQVQILVWTINFYLHDFLAEIL